MDIDHLEQIRASERLKALFWDLCEFSPLNRKEEPWFALQPEQPFEVVGADGSGGRFGLCEETPGGPGSLFYVSSEGEAGTIARNFPEGLQMMIALPYWRDCLKFSAGGNLEAMQRAQASFERELRKSRPDIDMLRRELYQSLRLDEPASPLEGLHAAVQAGTSRKVVATGDGWELGSLFNSFQV